MKNKILLTVCLLILFGNSFGSKNANNAAFGEKTITVLYTPEVENITETFIQEYTCLNQNLKFETKQVSIDQLPTEIKQENHLGFVLEKTNGEESKDLWKMLIARHIIVPITNAENPNLEKLEKTGISASGLKSYLFNEKNNGTNFYLLEDFSNEQCLANFIDVLPADLEKITFKVKTKEELTKKLQTDKTAVAFCCLLNVSSLDKDVLAESFKILPIDKNENGRVDYHEIVYRPLSEAEKLSENLTIHETTFGSLDAFERGIWIGKYPRTMVNNLYLVSPDFPQDPETSKFIAWALTEGQQFLEGTEFNQLVYNERQSKLDDLQQNEIIAATSQQEKADSKSILINILGSIILLALIIAVVSNFNKRKSGSSVPFARGQTLVLSEENLNIPGGVYFDKTHTWSFMEKDGTVKVGIDDFMQQVTGEYTNIKLKNPGDEVTKNEPLVTLVQNGKQIEIFAPVSGQIIEINEELVTDPSAINKSPYSEGWIYTIEPSNWEREISFMKMANSYKGWIKKEIQRLKEFLAVSVNAQNDKQIAFQDGGELNNHVMKQFGPRIWEDFQKNFIETSDLN